MAQRLLAAFAHPDDESFSSGGTLALLASRGVEVVVVTATRGDRGEILDPSLASPERLAVVREAELRKACRRLGVAQPILLDFGDGALGPRLHADLAAALQATVERFRPDVVLTFGVDGAYGHSDHVAIHRAATEAAVRSPVARLVYTACPRGLFAPQYDRMFGIGFAPMMGGVAREDLGTDVGAAEFAVDISPFAATKLGAIAAHRTQLSGGDPRTLFPDGIVESTLATEWFLLGRGAAPPSTPAADLFAGLPWPGEAPRAHRLGGW